MCMVEWFACTFTVQSDNYAIVMCSADQVHTETTVPSENYLQHVCQSQFAV